MPTPDERLTTLEKTVALLQKSASTDIQEVNRNTTMLLGIVSSQQLDIKEIKISLITLEERIDTIDRRLSNMEQDISQMKSMLTQVLARLPEKP